MTPSRPTPNRLAISDLTGPANALAPHYSRFRVADRLLLTGHSHQAWPDVARDTQVQAYDDAAESVDGKWERAFERAEAVRDGFRAWLGDPDGAIALGASTHDLVLRFLSALDLAGRPRIVTTDGEFHTLRRQLTRLGEAGLDIEFVRSHPAATLAERLAAAVDARTAAVAASSVLFETSQLVPNLDQLAAACTDVGAELLVDAYHQLGVMRLPVHDAGLDRAWVVGGGYKYLQLGEGNCFLRLPPQAADMRPVITGWYAEFGALAEPTHPDRVPYASGGDRFAGATYDPTSHYRATGVFDFFTDVGLTPDLLLALYRHKRRILTTAFDALDADDDVITRDRATPDDGFAGFLSLTSDRAAEVQTALADRDVRVDSRGHHLRFGPAPYLSDTQLETAIATLGEVLDLPTW